MAISPPPPICPRCEQAGAVHTTAAACIRALKATVGIQRAVLQARPECAPPVLCAGCQWPMTYFPVVYVPAGLYYPSYTIPAQWVCMACRLVLEAAPIGAVDNPLPK